MTNYVSSDKSGKWMVGGGGGSSRQQGGCREANKGACMEIHTPGQGTHTHTRAESLSKRWRVVAF